MSQDCYPIAAIRHFEDGVLLHRNGRKDNAMCHYAFSAECSAKAFAELLHLSGRAQNHDAKGLIEDIALYTELSGMLNPKFALLLGMNDVPAVLFRDHPERRYGADGGYSDSDLRESGLYVEKLVNHLVEAVLNGQMEM